MSEKPKDEPTNIYDEIRREMREKQQARRKHRQSVDELFNRPKNDDVISKLKGENK